MTPLADEILKILIAEAVYPPLSVEKVTFCLKVTGHGHELTVADVQAVLADLMQTGRIETVWRRGAAHYRVIQAARPVAARETDRPLP